MEELVNLIIEDSTSLDVYVLVRLIVLIICIDIVVSIFKIIGVK